MIVRESLFYLQVCYEYPPVKCEKYPERMHYILNCGRRITDGIS